MRAGLLTGLEDIEPRRLPTPLVGPAIALILGIAAAELAGPIPDLAAIASPLVAGMIYLLLLGRPVASNRWRSAARVVALTAIALVGVARHHAATALPANHVAHLTADEPRLMRLEGRLVNEPHSRPGERRNPFLPVEPPPRTEFVLDATAARTTDPPAEITGLVRVTVDADRVDAHAGDEVVISGWLYRPSGARNSGERDWAASLRLEGIHAGLSAPGAEHVVRKAVAEASGWARFSSLLRTRARALLLDSFDAPADGEPARLLDAMVLGQRSAVSRALNDAFMRTGTVHILSVSGFHVGLLALCVWWLVRGPLRRGPRTAAIVTMAVIVLYTIVAEQNAPILRAAVMGITACVARMRVRPINPLNLLAFSAIAILLVAPLDLFQAGFQLSFVQVAALLLVARPIHVWLTIPRDPLFEIREPTTVGGVLRAVVQRRVVDASIAAGVAWLSAVPLTMLYFQQFTPWAALQSLILLPLASAVIVAGFVALLLNAALNGAAAWSGTLLAWLTRALIGSADALGRVSGSLIHVEPPPAWLVWFTFAAIPVAAAWLRRAARRRSAEARGKVVRPPGRLAQFGPHAVAGAVALAWLVWLAAPRWSPARPELHVLSVGDGSAALLTLPDHTAMVFDLGTLANHDVGTTAINALRSLHVRRIRAASVSHSNFDHYSGLPTLLAEYPADALWLNRYFPSMDLRDGARRLLDRLPGDLAAPTFLEQGDAPDPDGALARAGLSLRLLWPRSELREGVTNNDTSLVFRLTSGQAAVLITGDIAREAMMELLERSDAGEIDLRADVLIAPHHGSIESGVTERFYKAVSPHCVIVSTGRERAKFRALVSTTLGSKCDVFTTRESGEIVVRLGSNGGFEIESPFARRHGTVMLPPHGAIAAIPPAGTTP